MVEARTDLSIDEDIRVDRAHGLAAVHQIEQLVAIENVHAGLGLGVPTLQLELESLAFSLGSQRLAEQVIDDLPKGTTLSHGSFLQPLEEDIV